MQEKEKVLLMLYGTALAMTVAAFVVVMT